MCFLLNTPYNLVNVFIVNMERVRDHEAFLQSIAKKDIKQGKKLISTAKPGQLDAICEVILNVIRGTVSIPAHIIKTAKKVHKVIRQLMRRYLGRATRRRLMVRYLPIVKKILKAALPVCTILLTAAQLR